MIFMENGIIEIMLEIVLIYIYNTGMTDDNRYILMLDFACRPLI